MMGFASSAHPTALCDELNETETLFPKTNLRLIYNVG